MAFNKRSANSHGMPVAFETAYETDTIQIQLSHGSYTFIVLCNLSWERKYNLLAQIHVCGRPSAIMRKAKLESEMIYGSDGNKLLI